MTTTIPEPFTSPDVIRFTVPGLPVAQPRQRHRIAAGAGRQWVQNYTPSKSPVNEYKAAVRLAAAQVVNAPLNGPLSISVVFVFPRGTKPTWLKKHSSWFWAWKDGQRVPHIARPDRDNLDKSTLDALKGIVFLDDKQAYCGRIEKWIAAGDEPAHVEVVIETHSITKAS